MPLARPATAPPPALSVTRAEVAQSARLPATTPETAWRRYLASGGRVAPDAKAKVDLALDAFQKLSDGLSAESGPATLTGAVYDVLAACNAILVALPPGTLPPNVVAAITAGEIVAQSAVFDVRPSPSLFMPHSPSLECKGTFR